MGNEQRVSLDELLQQQAASSHRFLCTVEAISGNEVVQVTPWVASHGCLCAFSFTVERSAVAAVVLTSDTHSCCGKQLAVVELNFAESHRAVAQVVHSQVKVFMASSARRGGLGEPPDNGCNYCHQHMVQRQQACADIDDPRKRAACYERARMWYEGCMEGCENQ
jgi:hypothetical protein